VGASRLIAATVPSFALAGRLARCLGHHLPLINVQAGAGLHLMDDRPEQARVRGCCSRPRTEIRYRLWSKRCTQRV